MNKEEEIIAWVDKRTLDVLHEIEVGTPPIHTHYDEELQRDELCGYVFCPKGFVGIKRKSPPNN